LRIKGNSYVRMPTISAPDRRRKIIAGGKRHQLFGRFVWRLAVVVANRATRERRRAWRAASHPAPSIVGP
jgi:hypothetical protein